MESTQCEVRGTENVETKLVRRYGVYSISVVHKSLSVAGQDYYTLSSIAKEARFESNYGHFFTRQVSGQS
jgi:hypothetical protein